VLRRVDWERTAEEARRLLAKVKMSHVSLDQRVEEFRVAERQLFEIIRSLKAEGVLVIFVSNTLEEIVHMMTGREDLARPAGKKRRGVTTHGIGHAVSFDLAAGETFAAAGLLDSGQTERMEALCGFRPPRAGISCIPKDRHVKGLMLNMPLLDNVCLANMNSDRECVFTSAHPQSQRVQILVRQLGIACSGVMQLVKSLGCCNQQKVLIARCLKANPRIEPTRGIDVGAKAEIYRLIEDFKEKSDAVLMVSTELPEILAESDRIMVMHEGRVTGFFVTEEATKEKLIYAMTA
jgi:ABC-type sugar transport system ATPase subunit